MQHCKLRQILKVWQKMSRKKRRQARYNPGGNPIYQQSGAMNNAYYIFFRSQIIKLALARFRWVGLPQSCDERYLELMLLMYGAATIAKPKNAPDFMSLQMVQQGTPNVYNNPVKWLALGANGTSFYCTHKNGIIVWDNMERIPLITQIDALAWDMSDIVRTKQVNRVHVKVPFVFVGSRENTQQLVNLYSQKVGNEPGIIVNNALLDNVSVNDSFFNTNVPYLGDKLNEDLKETWNMVYTMLGIRNLPFKLAQQNSEEVKVYDQPTELETIGSLQSRRKELPILSEWLGHEVKCVWNEDFESVNYNVSHNIQSLMKEGE